MTSAQVLSRIEELGATLSVDVDFDRTVLSLGVTKDHLADALDLLAKVVAEPRFDGGELAQAQGAPHRRSARRRARQRRMERDAPALPRALRGEEPLFALRPRPERDRQGHRPHAARLPQALLRAEQRGAHPHGRRVRIAGARGRAEELRRAGRAVPRRRSSSPRRSPPRERRARHPREPPAERTERHLRRAARPAEKQRGLARPHGREPSPRRRRRESPLRRRARAALARVLARARRSSSSPTATSRSSRTRAPPRRRRGSPSQGLLENIDRIASGPIQPSEIATAGRYLSDIFAIRLESIGAIADLVAVQDTYGLPDGYWDATAARSARCRSKARRPPPRSSTAAATSSSSSRAIADVIGGPLSHFGEVVVVDPEKELATVRRFPRTRALRSSEPRRASRARDRARVLFRDDARARHRAPRLRAGGSHPRARDRAGSHACDIACATTARRSRARATRASPSRRTTSTRTAFSRARPRTRSTLDHGIGANAPDQATAAHPPRSACSPPCASSGARTRASLTSAVAPARRTIVNAWGGQSRATTYALERLHRRGLVRVARRDHGVRVYELAPAREPAARDARLRVLVRAIASVLSPVLERTLRANVARFRHLGDPRAAIDALVREGALTRSTADGASYLHALCSVDEVGRPRSGSSPRSIHSSGTAAASSISGAGPTASRRTRPRPAHPRLLRVADSLPRSRRRMGQRHERRRRRPRLCDPKASRTPLRNRPRRGDRSDPNVRRSLGENLCRAPEQVEPQLGSNLCSDESQVQCFRSLT